MDPDRLFRARVRIVVPVAASLKGKPGFARVHTRSTISSIQGAPRVVPELGSFTETPDWLFFIDGGI